jgi:hypothetical protein
VAQVIKNNGAPSMWRGPRCVHFLPPSGLDPCPIKAPSHFRDAALLRITWEKTQSLFACHAVVRECVPGMCNEADSSAGLLSLSQQSSSSSSRESRIRLYVRPHVAIAACGVNSIGRSGLEPSFDIEAQKGRLWFLRVWFLWFGFGISGGNRGDDP